MHIMFHGRASMEWTSSIKMPGISAVSKRMASLGLLTWPRMPHIRSLLQKRQYWIRHDGIFKVNVAFGACCAAALAACTHFMVKQMLLCRRMERRGERIW